MGLLRNILKLLFLGRSSFLEVSSLAAISSEVAAFSVFKRLFLFAPVFTVVVISSGVANSKSVLTPEKVMKSAFGEEHQITRHDILLSGSEADQISKLARSRLKERVFRFYSAVDSKGRVSGFAMLKVGRVRAKNMAALYVIDTLGKIKSIEILAFHEPPEYKPDEKWLDVFKGKSSENNLSVTGDISNITGATLSARVFSDGARTATAIWKLRFDSTNQAKK